MEWVYIVASVQERSAEETCIMRNFKFELLTK
jgi:hypothetical protein